MIQRLLYILSGNAIIQVRLSTGHTVSITAHNPQKSPRAESGRMFFKLETHSWLTAISPLPPCPPG